jgi:hypothetical protein
MNEDVMRIETVARALGVTYTAAYVRAYRRKLVVVFGWHAYIKRTDVDRLGWGGL